MSTKKLHRIVGKAIVSEKFREGILNGKRAELMQQFNLEAEEFGAMMSIRANTLSDFARGVNTILARQDSR
ncbi:MAG: hypothetical protein HZB17_05690 [Chloroflexi bacterium]|nr:hypothetical protein [Chloroflexota bacterium]